MTKSAPVLTRVGEHGGRREGAGRKPLAGGSVTTTFVLTTEQAEWLEAQAIDQGCSKSEIVRALIYEHRAEATLKPRKAR